MTMNLVKSAASESDLDRFLLVFLLEDALWCLFFTGPVFHYPQQSQTCVGNVPKEKPIYLGWDGGYTASILKLGVGLQAFTNFKSSVNITNYCHLAVIKLLFSQCNLPLATTN